MELLGVFSFHQFSSFELTVSIMDHVYPVDVNQHKGYVSGASFDVDATFLRARALGEVKIFGILWPCPNRLSSDTLPQFSFFG